MRTLQIRDRQLGIVLERIKRLVTQQLLDVIHVRTGAQQLGRAAAPERMRGYRDIQPGRFRVGMYKPPQCVIGQPITRPIQKERRLSRIVQEMGADHFDVRLKIARRTHPIRYHTLLAPLAHYHQSTPPEPTREHLIFKGRSPGRQAEDGNRYARGTYTASRSQSGEITSNRRSRMVQRSPNSAF